MGRKASNASNPKPTGGATFEPDGEPIVFLASNFEHIRRGARLHPYVLIAVNEVAKPEQLAELLDAGSNVLIDSGIYNLAVTHAKRNEITMDEALGMDPDQVDGWAELFARYVDLVTRFGEQAWGYIELDLGGRENKIKTRAKLEDMGLSPIPVYHPLNDGWDYFDYLASTYDRICVGNLVMANDDTRSRIMTTIASRRKAYPGLKWVHALGVGLTHRLISTQVNSSDASSWLNALRWGGGATDEFSCCTMAGNLSDMYTYRIGSGHEAEDGYAAAITMLSSIYWCHIRNLRHLIREAAVL